MLKNFPILLAVIFFALFAAFLFVSADWTPPPCRPGAPCDQPPPTCPPGAPGCDNPLHTGRADQTKIGNLTIEGMLDIRNRLRVGGGLPPSGVRVVVSGTPVFLNEIYGTAGTPVYQCPIIAGCPGATWQRITPTCAGQLTTLGYCRLKPLETSLACYGWPVIPPQTCTHIGYLVGFL